MNAIAMAESAIYWLAPGRASVVPCPGLPGRSIVAGRGEAPDEVDTISRVQRRLFHAGFERFGPVEAVAGGWFFTVGHLTPSEGGWWRDMILRVLRECELTSDPESPQ